MTKAKAARKRAPSSTAIGRVELLLEDLNTKMTLFGETVGGSIDSLRREMQDMRAELITRIEVLESVVRQNSRDIAALRVDVDGLRVDVEALRNDVEAMRSDMRALATQSALQQLEARVSKIEARVFP